MTTSDSGLIDLFAIQKEEQVRVTAPVPSAPPPGVSFDTVADDDDDDDYDVLAAAQRQSRKRMKLIGGALGGVAVLGILVFAMTSGETKEPEKAAPPVAAAPPPVVTAPPPPAAEPAPAAPTPEPPSTAKSKPDYTPATAAAAYAAGSKKRAPVKPAKIGGGMKLQKVQSGGTGG
ncbi:MAG TPA: hypothetical protein VM925_11815 [Labilithrix sp.]|nr:hypothetical protein [Labilithrix sp.]